MKVFNSVWERLSKVCIMGVPELPKIEGLEIPPPPPMPFTTKLKICLEYSFSTIATVIFAIIYGAIEGVVIINPDIPKMQVGNLQKIFFMHFIGGIYGYHFFMTGCAILIAFEAFLDDLVEKEERLSRLLWGIGNFVCFAWIEDWSYYYWVPWAGPGKVYDFMTPEWFPLHGVTWSFEIFGMPVAIAGWYVIAIAATAALYVFSQLKHYEKELQKYVKEWEEQMKAEMGKMAKPPEIKGFTVAFPEAEGGAEDTTPNAST